MKKLILSLLIMCSAMAFSQGTIPIPQIIGLPAALASKVDKVTGKSLVADTSVVKLTGIQAGAQVNKIEGIQKNGVDLTITGKKVNITVPTTAAEIGAQPAGTYATGTGTAYNSNNGDETLTSIKTKLGAATSVSDGYLKYQDFADFSGKLSSEVDGSVTNELQTISTTGAAGNITLSNSGGTLNLNVNDADASATNEIQDLSLSGNTLTLSSDATTVDISQATAVLANTAKVSNATHTGDVTGSTALTLATVNSNVGTFNNITINAKGLATAGSNVSYQSPLTIGNLTSTTSGVTIGNGTGAIIGSGATVNIATAGVASDGILTSGHFNTFNNKEPAFSKNTAFNKNFGTTAGTVLEGRTFGTAANSSVGDFQPIENQRLSTANSPSFNKMTSTVATGAAPLTVNSTTMVGNLNAQYLDGHQGGDYFLSRRSEPTGINANSLTQSGSYAIFGNSTSLNYPINGGYGNLLTFDSYYGTQIYSNYTGDKLYFRNSDGSAYSSWKEFYHSGNLTNNLTTNYITKWNGSTFVNATAGTDYQLPITLTTNGTSGAATLSGNVLNVPNYDGGGGVNQTQTTFNGSTSGNIVCSMPFQTSSYKKVIIRFSSLNGTGTNTYTYPVAFTNDPAMVWYNYTGTQGSTTVGRSSIIFSGTASNHTGYMLLEGY